MNISTIKRRIKLPSVLIVILGFFALAGIAALLATRAATSSVSLEPESGALSAPAARISDPAASGASAVSFGQGAGVGTSTTPNFKVAFVGDTGLGTESKAVLNLIKSEGASLFVHLGDFDYENNPTGWNNFNNTALGSTFPMNAVVGNHDTGNTSAYRAETIKHLGPQTCTGTRITRAVCKMNGLVVIESGIGIATGSNDAADVAYVRDTLAANSTSLWKVCAWHAQMATLQVGGKTDETGYTTYEECRKAGALVFTGHEHSYQRTKTLTSFTNQTVDATCNTVAVVCVGPNRSFTAVSGAGGRELRVQVRCLPTSPPYGCKGEWAKIYTTNQSAKSGVLFVTFNYNGNPKLAKGVFKNIAGEVVDDFEIRRD